MDKDICTLLTEIRDKTDWSETKIATEISVSQPTVNRILAGQSDCKGKTYQAILGLHARIFSEIYSSLLPPPPKETPCPTTP